jgi:hypothetical protein
MEIQIGAGIELGRFADMERARQTVRSLGVNRRAGCSLDFPRRGRMVAVGVGDENGGDSVAAHGVEQRCDVRIVVGAGIEDRDFAAADNVADRTFVGERPGIVGDDRSHSGRHRCGATRHQFECLVIADVVVHRQLSYCLFGPKRRVSRTFVSTPERR